MTLPHLVHRSAAGIAARPTSRKLAEASCASSYGQCGGTSCQASGCPSSLDSAWTCCLSGFTCQRQSQYYWQCLTGNSSALSSSPAPSSPKQSSPTAMSPPAQPSSSPSALLAVGTTNPQGNAAGRSLLAPASLTCQVMCIPLVMSMFVRALCNEGHSNSQVCTCSLCISCRMAQAVSHLAHHQHDSVTDLPISMWQMPYFHC